MKEMNLVRLLFVGGVALTLLGLEAAQDEKVVSVSDVDSRYFMDGQRRTWVPIGCNICFDRLDSTSEEMRRRFDGWLTALAANGGNYTRFWLGARRTDIMPAEPYVFDKENEDNLVWLVRRAEALGLKVKLTLEHFRETKPEPATEIRYPGSACIAGTRSFTKPLYWPYAKNMGEFFRSRECFDIYLAKARRVAELVGRSPAVMAIETWNEINATCAPIADIEAWSNRMNAELKRLFPRQLVLTNLGSFSDAADGFLYDYLARQRDNDYLQVHRYRDPGAMSDVAHGPMDVLCADAIRELHDRRPDVPAVLAETGATERWHSDISHHYAQDKEGLLLHDEIFAPFFAGSAGSGQPWHWDHQYIALHNLWWHFRRFQTAIAGVDPAREHMRPFYLETARLRVWGLRGERTVIGWCRDKLDTIEWSLERGRKALPVMGERLPKAALGCGKNVEWYLPFEDRRVSVKAGTEVPTFTHSIVFRANVGEPRGTVSSSSVADEWIYDRYGQMRDFDFAAKVTDDAQLKADAVADEKYYASFTAPKRTYWGGLPGSKEKYGLTATGFFHLEEVKGLGGRTCLVDPEGNLYFNVAMCCLMNGNEFTPVQGRESVFEWVPSAANGFGAARDGTIASYYIANWLRKYGSFDRADWQRKMVERCRKWGFNAYGAFTHIYDSNHDLGFSTTACLEHYMKDPGFVLVDDKHFDPFDNRNAEPLEKALRRRMKPYLGKAELLGWYTENETRYNLLMPNLLKTTTPLASKRKLAEFLKERHAGDVAKFNAAWGVAATSFDDVVTLALKAESETARKDAKAFEAVFYDQFFKVLAGALKRIDPDHLYLGERMIPEMGAYQPVVAALGKYCDIHSVNYYTNGFDPETVRRYAAASGRPVLLSEWSFGTCEQGLFGCRNCESQEISGREYRRYVENAAALDCVVGAQFFCLLDEPASGRGWRPIDGECGERMQMGFLNTCDRPFKTFVAQAAAGNASVYEVMTGAKKAFDCDKTPRKIMYAGTRVCGVAKVKSAALDGDSSKYGKRSSEIMFMSVKKQGRLSDKSDWGRFDFGWDASDFRFLVTMPDATPATNVHGGPIDRGDWIAIYLGPSHVSTPGLMLPDDRELLIRVNTTGAPAFEWRRNGKRIACDLAPRTFVALTEKGWTMEVAVPWAAVGFTPEVGKEFRFELNVGRSGASPDETVDTIVWNGLGNDDIRRDTWGRGILRD